MYRTSILALIVLLSTLVVAGCGRVEYHSGMMDMEDAAGESMEHAEMDHDAMHAAESESEAAESEAAESEAAAHATDAAEAETIDAEASELDSAEPESAAPESAESAVDTPAAGVGGGNGQAGRGNGAGTGGGNGGMMGGGMMGGGGMDDMRARHQAPIPAEYRGMVNAVPADDASFARGEESFNLLCASCHGEQGLGDGPAAGALDPAPPMISMTSLMLGDDYLFWRISDGGAMAPFNSAMPAWRDVLDEQTRWDVINYTRTLNGAGRSPEEAAAQQRAMHEEMIAAGVEQGLISQDEGELFLTVHDQMDLLRNEPGRTFTGNPDEMQTLLLDELLAGGFIQQSEADVFTHVHDALVDAGLMQ